MAGKVTGFYDHQQGLYIRKNCEDLTDKDWQSLRKGVEVMKKLSPFDPRSWTYQANIHGWENYKLNPEENARKHWTQCQHGEFFFLPWHRAYIFFFERILRAMSGDPNLTLCYWNYNNES